MKQVLSQNSAEFVLCMCNFRVLSSYYTGNKNVKIDLDFIQDSCKTHLNWARTSSPNARFKGDI